MVLVNITLNLLLVRLLNEAGIALSTTISGTLNFLLLARLLQKKFNLKVPFPRGWELAALAICCLLMVCSCYFCLKLVKAFLPGDDLPARLVACLGPIATGALLYLLLLKLLGFRLGSHQQPTCAHEKERS
jgi:peptidoglycan biosynthesis protein MviN/MurJ (putative lipid II flippase)